MLKFEDTTRVGRSFAKDPSVIRRGGRYLMYYTIPPYGEDMAPEGAVDSWAIGIAESTDLLSWNKVGEILPEQKCEQNGIVSGRVIELDGILHLFYNTIGNGMNDGICHATSEDGLQWKRDESNPIFGPHGDWNCGRATDADVIEYKGQILLYCATQDPSFRTQFLVVAGADRDSDLGADAWRQLVVLPLLKPEMQWEKKSVSAPSVVKRGDNIYMFYAGGYNDDPQQIGVAMSRDGVKFKRIFHERPFLKNGRTGEWNSSESGHPAVFVDDGETYLFYQGNDDHGKSSYISWVKIGWGEDGKPFVVD